MAIKPVAYVGIGTQETPNIQAPTKIDTPQYPDKGVSFAGFSKSALSNNQFKLNTQQENSIHVHIGPGIPAGTYNIDRANGTKNFIIQFVEIAYNMTANFRLDIDDRGSNGMTFRLPLNTSGVTFRQIVPKTYISQIIDIILDTAVPAGGFIAFSLYGWYEDK